MTDKQIIEAAEGNPLSSQTTRLSLRNLKGLGSFAPLTECKNLDYLLLRAPGLVPPLDPLIACPKLRSIAIREKTKIKDFSFLERFPQLKKLEVNQRVYEQLDGLSSKISELEVHSATIDQLSYFRNFSELRQLELGSDTGIYTKINDSTDFSPVKQLERLFLMSRLLSHTKPLEVLKDCRSLFLGSNKKLKDISGLNKLSKLEALVCDRTSVKDIMPLNGLGLRYLSLGGTKINSLKGLALPKLVHLYLGKCRLKKLVLDTSFPELELLSLAQNPIQDIQAIQQFKSLKYLCLWGCPNLSDFSPLIGLTKLKALDLSYSALKMNQFEELINLPNLEQIAIYDTQISEDPVLLKKAQKMALDRNIQLAVERVDLIDFQKPYYRLMNFYLHAYQGKNNPWYDEWKTGYHV